MSGEVTLSKPKARVSKVLARLAELAADDEEFAESLAPDLQMMLDDMHGCDCFGTEAQNDPRGDFRNGNWSMSRVEGVDA